MPPPDTRPGAMPGAQPAAAPPPSPADLSRIHTIEQCAFRAWPALQTERHGDWLLRLSAGFTKRANSANAALPGAAFDGVQAAAERLYARHGLPAVFRLTPLAAPEADARLAAAGYAVFDPSRVMTRLLDGDLPPWAPQVEIADRPTAEWLDGFAAANGVAPHHHATHHAMVRAISQRTGFATLRSKPHDLSGSGSAGAGAGAEGPAIGFGLAVRDGDAVGFFDIVIAPAHRRQGHALVLMQALMHWARTDGAAPGPGRGDGAPLGTHSHGTTPGARWAYLQVRDHNPAARRLYAGLGFTDLYRYHYRVPAAPGAAQAAATAGHPAV